MADSAVRPVASSRPDLTLACLSPIPNGPLTPDLATPSTPKTPADEGKEFFLSERSEGEEPIRVYELKLDPDGGPNKERSYIRLPPAYTPYILRVSLDAGAPASKNGVFRTNFPLDGGVFERHRFTERRLPIDLSKPIQVDLPISHAGAFVYWVEYDGDAPGERIKGREGYFNIDPILRVRARSPILSADSKPLLPSEGGAKLLPEVVNLPLDALAILTVVSKWMGPISQWRNHFEEASDRGYSMLHWTPLQERGSSNSPYSIKDQKKYDLSVFDTPVDSESADSEIEEILRIAKDEYGLLSLTDVVLNHTANDSTWLADHPEAGYSPSNTPHLSPALELDTAIIEFSSSLVENGLPTRVSSQKDIDTLMEALAEHVKAKQLWQFYVLDVEAEKDALTRAFSLNAVVPWTGEDVTRKTVVELAKIVRSSGLIQGEGTLASRFAAHVDGEVSAGLIKAAFVTLDNDVGALVQAWSRVVDVLNVPLYEECNEDTRIALDNIKNRLKYTRLDEHGPKLGEISKDSPLVESYFTRISPHYEADPATYSVANNGWLWNADPLVNFALPPSKAYLRREVIVWGDCVKLRYGSGPSDNPWLWEYMTSYVTSLARTFDGFRIDNCHSTPLHVGTAMLDTARKVNPDLYVCAELFTGSEDMDLLFVQKLGVNSLVREAGNAWDVQEFSRVMHRFGLGKPVGSMDEACMTSMEELAPPFGTGPTRPCIVSPLNGSTPHALMYDLTHDNESYLDKRTAEHALAVAGIVTFGYCAVGSVKGFDDLYPKLLKLVDEERTYEITQLSENSGIARAKRVLNGLRREMIMGGYTEGCVWRDFDYIIMTRMHPITQHAYVLVAHTAFEQRGKGRGSSSPSELVRTKAKFICGFAIDIPSYDTPDDQEKIKGLHARLVDLPEVPIEQKTRGNESFCSFGPPEYFPPGSIMIFETQLEDVDLELDRFCMSDAQAAFDGLDLVDLNVVLYRADGEERDATDGESGVYNLPGIGRLSYCGLEGWMHPLRHIIQHNDLGHALCENLRRGTWALDYVVSRLSTQMDTFPNLAAPIQWFLERFQRIRGNAPPYLRPKFFAIVIVEAYKAARRAVIEQCSEFVSNGHDFTQNLAMCAVQMHGMVKSASLDPGKPTPSLAAGLPHFSSGWARCWGRDVFISLRGLFLTTGNFEGAKSHILAFASTLKHGLIPNLLDSANNPRYNSRDSPWWMLQNIQDYVNMAPSGHSILSESVPRRFPVDDSWVPWHDSRAYAYTSTLAEIIQEILQRHASGISFREHNAGPNLDQQMKDNGFNINIYVDWNTGLVLGGNGDNCGTWMDKMGESIRAGTKGVPGTPRDGAPVEIVGLVKSTVRWLDELAREGKFPYRGVVASIDGKDTFVTYGKWNDLIQKSFEKYFYVPLDPSDDSKYVIDAKLVNRRGIYKDVYGSGPGREWSDYQFRPNFTIAMTVAPELFDKRHALHALQLADRVLRGPLGMKTLDPSDMQYRPNYDNSNDSDDPFVAKGLNYHCGPEWGWPLGYFLRAYLYFDMRFGEGKDVSCNVHIIIPDIVDGAGKEFSRSHMSFFGFEANSLEEEKRRFLEGRLQESEDLAVYTWGEDSYDGLGDALLEGGDELNDETFGGTDEVGKDFDFTQQTLPDPIGIKPEKRSAPQEPPRQQTPLQDRAQLVSRPTGRVASPSAVSLEAIWDDKSPFSLLPRSNGTSRGADHQRVPSALRTTFPAHAFTDHRAHDQQARAQSQTPVPISQIQHQPSLQARRQASYGDLQMLQQRRTHSPAYLGTSSGEPPSANQHNAQFLPQNIQMQQRLLSEMAQAEFMREMQGISQVEQDALRAEAMRKIMETERMEEKRRRKASKIAHMSRYNDLMTQSDKDFITRIQVSQLVTQDPYADDFYAQVYGAILRSRMGLQSGDERVLKFGSGGGIGLGLGQKIPGRRQSAMQKMEAQVERIVNSARLREKEKGLHSLQSLQGALGKTAGRSYKAAPRQLLQVDGASTSPSISGSHPHISKDDAQNTTWGGMSDSNGAAREAAKLGREALGDAAGTDSVVRKEPLTHRQILVALEALYDLVLAVEQLRRDQPPEDDVEALEFWSKSYDELSEQIWVGLKVLIPLETSDPHPFISLLTPIKGKKILPRLCRHIPAQRLPTLLTLLVACFSQLDIVAQAQILDTYEDSPERQEVERQTAAFLGSVLQSVLPVVARAELRLVTGLLGLLLDRSDIVHVAKTRPGVAMLTLFLSRVEIIKQEMSSSTEATEFPTPEEAQQWQLVFDHLFQLLFPHFDMLFPSTRLALHPSPPTSAGVVQHTDLLDQPVWQFLAAVALHASPDQQSTLVAGLREKVLENVASVHKGWITDEEERSTKLANVNLFLHALGLDSSQITV
ncbi:hypothetical protein ID866_3356 [Astraeus odoratus]|nr:hypothetical protein ID866_3356 [Astraeus odoratus]